jgi:pyruvate,water dikinase
MVASYTDIGWSPFYCLIDALVTEVGSALSHGAVVAREYALPFVTNVSGATSLFQTGDLITVDGTTGHITRH